MEASRRNDVITGAAAPPQGRCYDRRGGGGGSGYESDGSSSGGVELSLRLTTGSSLPVAAAPAVEQDDEAAARRRRSMTIFYNGRVCAVDVTEIQAREIISMANQETLAHHQRQQHREDRHAQDRGSSTITTGSATARCGGQVRSASAAAAAGCPRQGLATMAAPMATADQAGLSMKRSLQRFLQKREARRAAAVAPPYAAGGRQAQAMRH